MNWMRRLYWLLFGGAKVEEMFVSLSGSIVNNRITIADLETRCNDLEMRVLKIEDHTVDQPKKEPNR